VSYLSFRLIRAGVCLPPSRRQAILQRDRSERASGDARVRRSDVAGLRGQRHRDETAGGRSCRTNAGGYGSRLSPGHREH